MGDNLFMIVTVGLEISPAMLTQSTQAMLDIAECLEHMGTALLVLANVEVLFEDLAHEDLLAKDIALSASSKIDDRKSVGVLARSVMSLHTAIRTPVPVQEESDEFSMGKPD